MSYLIIFFPQLAFRNDIAIFWRHFRRHLTWCFQIMILFCPLGYVSFWQSDLMLRWNFQNQAGCVIFTLPRLWNNTDLIYTFAKNCRTVCISRAIWGLPASRRRLRSLTQTPVLRSHVFKACLYPHISSCSHAWCLVTCLFFWPVRPTPYLFPPEI